MHPAGLLPSMLPFAIDRCGPYSHHVEGWRDKNEFVNDRILLSHQSRDPATERIAHNGNRRTARESAEHPRIVNPIG